MAAEGSSRFKAGCGSSASSYSGKSFGNKVFKILKYYCPHPKIVSIFILFYFVFHLLHLFKQQRASQQLVQCINKRSSFRLVSLICRGVSLLLKGTVTVAA